MNTLTSAERAIGTQHALISLADRVSKIYPFCTQALLGDTSETVATYAQEIEADLILVGSHNPGFLTTLLHLDQASRLAHSASGSVLVYATKRTTGSSHEATTDKSNPTPGVVTGD